MTLTAVLDEEEFERLIAIQVDRYRAAAGTIWRPGRRCGEADSEQEPRPYPMAELERAMRARSSLDAGERLHVSGATLNRLRSSGLTVWEADRYACRAGLHPGWVWDSWWEPVE